MNESVTVCTRCIYDSNVPLINFNADGICNYCLQTDKLVADYGILNGSGQKTFDHIVTQIKKDGRNKKYDCVVGVSGGVDSSYMLHKAIEWGLRPLAVHYDNTWNSAIATENIKKMLKPLNVDLYTYVVDNKEVDDIFKAFFKSGVPELDASTDLALAEVLYRAADKYGVKYILEGHSFMTEGIAPLGSFYFDGKYISSIHKKFGKLPMKTYPLMDFISFMKWIAIKRIKKIRPYWYLNYSKEEARAFLEKVYDWKYYGGHHLENRLVAFNHSYYLPKKFGVDLRNLSLAAAARTGRISREEALRQYSQPPHLEDGLVEYFKTRLVLADKEFEDVICGERKSYKDYPTYKPLFEKLRPFFYVLAKANLVPMSFYIKYTSKSGV
ncbi:N-acetyl sugar amidotransferase [Bdellovibrio bacteriovorus]|uniref:N-acetyl sugar amidotransferase n=1 Tax=Bdellovibrio bacteriovorus TaxID=959 RepID=UPI0035A9A576